MRVTIGNEGVKLANGKMLIEGAIRLKAGRSFVPVSTYRVDVEGDDPNPLDMLPIGRASNIQRLPGGEVTAEIEIIYPLSIKGKTVSMVLMPKVEIEDSSGVNVVEAELVEIQYV